MPVQPLQPTMSNKAAFVNSLFDSDVRDPSQNGLGSAIDGGALRFPYADGGSEALMLGAWNAAWQAYLGAPFDPAALARCPQQDVAGIGFLAGYIAANPVDLCVPALTFDHLDPASELAVYRDAGYQRLTFGKDPTGLATVATFLQLLYFGAHIVAISSSRDGGSEVADLSDALSDSKLPLATDVVSSHYGGSAFLTGRYYAAPGGPTPGLRDTEIFATSAPPGNEPLLFSILVGVTASTHRNCFLQLEGWPAQRAISPPGGQRHNADYVANEQTLWNFATYGASVFSEKRSTPIFLANRTFDLTLHADTGMPYYWGANAGNIGDGWMHPQLVIV